MISVEKPFKTALLLGFLSVFFLSGCFPTDEGKKQECFQIVETKSAALILLDKCSGNTWKLGNQLSGKDNQELEWILIPRRKNLTDYLYDKTPAKDTRPSLDEIFG